MSTIIVVVVLVVFWIVASQTIWELLEKSGLLGLLQTGRRGYQTVLWIVTVFCLPVAGIWWLSKKLAAAPANRPARKPKTPKNQAKTKTKEPETPEPTADLGAEGDAP